MVTCPFCSAQAIPGFKDTYDCDCYLTPAWAARFAQQSETIPEKRQALIKSLPPRYQEYVTRTTPTGFRTSNPALYALAMKQFAEGGILYLHGPSGTGKSHLAVRVATRLLETVGLTAAFVGEADYFKSLTDSFGGQGAAFDATTPQVLVYDDLGRRRPTPVVLDELYRILEHRWSHRKTLIVTSNFSPVQAVTRLTDDTDLGGGILSRLVSGDVFAVIGAQDYRIGTARSA